MNRSRRLLMVAFVATALAADRMVAAAPNVRPQMAETARKLTGRLVVSFRRTVPSVRFQPYRRDSLPADQVRPAEIADDQPAPKFEFSPFEYRLPPPQA